MKSPNLLNPCMRACAKLEANSELSAAQRVKIMTPVIDAAFDLPTILRNSVGMRFANLNAQDQRIVSRLVPTFHCRALCVELRQG